MAYRIITDTCCDLPAQMYEELNLKVVPLSVNFKGQTLSNYTEQWPTLPADALLQAQSSHGVSIQNPDPRFFACARMQADFQKAKAVSQRIENT